jgi:signal recognition particle subunit SRP54
MMPGFSSVRGQIKDEELDEVHLKRMEAIVLSMTPDERRNPNIIDGSRRRRIARGSGSTPHEVNQLLNQWKEAKKLMHAVAAGRGPGALRMFR